MKGLFVDRGWLAQEYSELKAHWNGKPSEQVTIEGVVIYGEGKSHTGKGNDEVNKIRIDLEEFVQRSEFHGNPEQAKRIMIKEVNFSESASNV